MKEPTATDDETSADVLVPFGLRWRLSLMMFLQYAVLGSWAPILAIHLNQLGFDGVQIWLIYSTIAFASMVAPFVAGQIADRYFATERYMALAHLAGAGLLFYAGTLTTFTPLFVVMLLYCTLFTPTAALSNSLSFAHLPKPEKTFGAIRLWGTIGWVVVSGVFGLWLGMRDDLIQRFLPALAGAVGSLQSVVGQPSWGHCLPLAGGLSVALGLLSLALPHTAPTKSKEKPWAFLEAIKLTRHRDFAVLAVVTFFIATELAFYYQLTSLFFKEGLGIPDALVAPVMAIGQVAEVVALLLLPASIARFGMRGTIALGIVAWPVRYVVFAIGGPLWLVLSAQLLHGICFGFFVVASQIYVDSIAERDIRASAQNLLAFLYTGVGKLVGNLFAGRMDVYFGRDFRKLFLLPAIITTVFLGVFLAGFKGKKVEAEEPADEEEAAGE